MAYQHESVGRPANERPPRYVATLRALETAVHDVCAMTPQLHDLIGVHALRAPLVAFVRVAAEAMEPPESVLRRVKHALRPYERLHERQSAELVHAAIVSYYSAQA